MRVRNDHSLTRLPFSSSEADLSQEISDVGAGLEKGEDGKIHLRRPKDNFDGRDMSQGFHLILLYSRDLSCGCVC